MTAEERARAVLSGDYGGGGWSDLPSYADDTASLRVAMTRAIRAAENDAYERAASLAHFDCGRHGTQEIGRMILDLKHKQGQA